MINIYKKISVTLLVIILLSIRLIAQNNSVFFEQEVYLPKQKTTVYALLNELSKQTGMLFIYDSKVINNENVVKIKAGKRSLKEAILEVVGNPKIHLNNIGKHILLTSCESDKSDALADSLKTKYSVIEGKLVDAINNEPIAYGSVGLSGSSLGTISNQEGIFKLIVPEVYSKSSEVLFSHLGYEQQKISFSTLNGHFSNISLQPRVMSLPEVVVKAIDPIKLIEKMRRNIENNYFMSPSYLTTFYREGIDYNDNFRSLTEAVIKLYKSPYKSVSVDQVQLLKMRKVSNYSSSDTIIAKMSSGIDASLKLDVIKDLPDFLFTYSTYNNSPSYNYKYIESTIIDGKMVDVIYFTQKKNVVDPRYAGKLYITSDESALVRVEMCILPEMVKNATDMFVSKQAQYMKLTLSKVDYIINYKKFGDYYFINHVRGDIYFKAKRRKKLFNSSSIHTWFEMLPCKIDTVNVAKFSRNERISPHTVFSETVFEYDHNFWGEYNIITLEQKIEDAIRNISPKIEVMK